MFIEIRSAFALPTALLLVAAAGSLTQPASAQSGVAPKVRLTPIEDGFSGAACRLHLTQRGTGLVGGMDYYNENSNWHVGINSHDYRLKERKPTTADPVLMSADRKISVRITRLQKVWESRDPSYPAVRHRVSISLTFNGSTATFTAYQTCGDG